MRRWTLLGLFAAITCTSCTATAKPPVIIHVETVLPGSSVEEVESILAVPMEKALRGLKGMERIDSVTFDGRAILSLTFDSQADPVLVRQTVRKRLETIRPNLPEATALRFPPIGPGHLAKQWLVLQSETRSTNELSELSRAVTRPSLLRIPGLADVSLRGESKALTRVLVDPDRLRQFDVTADEVIAAIRKFEVDERADRRSPAKLEIIEVKKLANAVVLLRDLARIDQGSSTTESARLGKRPAVALGLVPTPDVDASLAADEVKRLRDKLPADVRLTTFPGQGSRLMRIDLHSPEGMSIERAAAVSERIAAAIGEIAGVADVLSIMAPEPEHGLLLAAINADVDIANVATSARTALRKFPEIKTRVRDLDSIDRFPIEIALLGEDLPTLAAWCDSALTSIEEKGLATEIEADRIRPSPRLHFDVDREKLKAMDLSLAVVMEVLRTLADRESPISIRFGERAAGAPLLNPLTVRTSAGQIVPLGTVVQAVTTTGFTMIRRIDGRRAIVISGQPKGAVSAADWIQVINERTPSRGLRTVRLFPIR